QYYERWRIPAAKMVVVPNGVDERRFRPEALTDEIRKQYHLQSRVVVGFVGSFHFWHGLEHLMQFMKLTLARFDGVTFLLVGEGPLKHELEQKVQQDHLSDRVIFAGYVPHEKVPAYLSAMDIVLAPYPRLDFFYYSPLKLFEYLAAGKAVIASRIGQITEIIQDGINGVLVDPDDFDELQRQLFLLIEDEDYRERLGENGRKTIIEQYTWRHTAQKILAVMDEMMTKDKES
ncbi:MAG: glycosyltransferase family 4 protein, partial [candidate division KSB1 bacterium]|nr:glycosyltransferase family 4 protein [candidate division KSB1 bacterium]